MKTNNHLISRFYVVIGSLLFVCSALLHAATGPEMLVSPISDGGIKGIYDFLDANGSLNLVYERSYPNRPSDFFSIKRQNNAWSSPSLISVPHQNARALRGAVNLANGTPMVLMSSDNTDYAKLFNITGSVQISPNGVPQGTGMTPDQIRHVLMQGQRLFFSMQIGNGWSTPLPIPGSNMVSQSILVAGSDGGAMVVFSKDGDGNPATSGDSEVYASVYQSHQWSVPVKITNNTLLEHAIQAVYSNGAYVVTWVADKDGDLTDRSDSSLEYATVSATGTIVKQATAVVPTLQNNPAPILGVNGTQAVLLWTSDVTTGASERGVFESRYSGTWTSPVNTGLHADYLLGAKLQTLAEGLVLIYKDAGIAKASLYSGGKWGEPAAIMKVDGIGYEYFDYHFSVGSGGELWLIGAANIMSGNSAAGTGLYLWHELLRQDLAIRALHEIPVRKEIGKQIKLKWSVSNNGVFPSSGYVTEVYRDSVKVAEFAGTMLPPGENKSFEYPFIMDLPQIPFEIRVAPQFIEQDANNSMARTVKVLPDFDVRSVTHPDATHFTADIVETKGISAPAVSVEFYLIENSQLNLIAKGEFDPNSNLPITVATTDQALIDRVTPYQILVKVNKDRKVKEDDYENNESSFIYRPQPDYEVSQLYLTETDVYVSVRNSGNKPATVTDILLTDDPLVASQSVQADTPWHYQEVTLDASGQAQLVIPRAGKSAFTGEVLYAVVNPYGQRTEANRNNNMRKVSVTALTPLAGGTPGGPAPMAPALAISRIKPWCTTLQMDVANGGTAPAIASRMELFDSTGYLAAVQTLPVIMPASTETITVQNLLSGSYAIRLVYNSDDGAENIVQGQVTVNPGAMCAGVSGNDVRIVGLQPTQIPGQLQVVVDVAAIGYQLNYKKPLIHIPIELEVKQGISSIYRTEKVAYLGGGTVEDVSQVMFAVPLATVLTGKLQLIATIPVRDDEGNTVNNVQVMELTVGAN